MINKLATFLRTIQDYTMKTQYILPAFVLLVLVGCNKEEALVQEPFSPAEEQKETSFAFTSRVGEITKVTIGTDNRLFWSNDDQIAVYNYKDNTVIQSDVASISGGEGTRVGTFSPDNHTTNSDWYLYTDANSQTYSFYAFYPGSSTIPTDKVVNVSVADNQEQSLGFGKYVVSYAAASISKSTLASGTAPNFSFSPKNALLKLTLYNNSAIPVKISSIRISSSVKIAGNATLNLSTGVLSSGSSTSITYTPNAPIEIAAGAMAPEPVYISLLPCSPGSLTVTLNQAGFKYNAPSITLATIESGHVYAKDAAISSASRELAISNSNTTNLANSAAMDADATLYYGTTNCIVMDANDVQGIIPIGVYKSSDGYTRSNASAGKNTAVKKAKVIWAEKDLYEDPNFCIASGTTGMLTVTKSAGVTGNALIGIYDGDDALLWSYHVWCPFDKSVVSVYSEGTSTHFSAFKLALGQVTGADCDSPIYYQWGRKDPLGRSNPNLSLYSMLTVYGGSTPTVGNRITATSTGESVNNLSYARKHPATFICNSDGILQDWYPAKAVSTGRTTANQPHGQNDNLWVNTKATIFDPCPSGYRVAPMALWDGTTNSKEAGPLLESAGLWYVLAGSRYRVNGTLDGPSIAGGYWSSKANGGDSQFSSCLSFNSDTGLYRYNYIARAAGLSVRCVK